MANLTFTQVETGWWQSQPVQLKGNKFAVSLLFGDTADNRVVVMKSTTGTEYVPHASNVSTGNVFDMNIEGLIAGQWVCVKCNEEPVQATLLESTLETTVTTAELLAESGRAQTVENELRQTINNVKSKADKNEEKLNTIPKMPPNDGKVYGYCNGAWVEIMESGKTVYTT